MVEQPADNIRRFFLKSWKKIAPCTIESWIVSNQKREQELVDEALRQIGEEPVRAYLLHLLRGERRAQLTASWISIVFHSAASLAVLFGWGIDDAFLNPAKLLLTVTFLVTMIVFGKTTKLQRRIFERAATDNNVHDLPVLLAAENPSDTKHQIDVNNAVVNFLLQIDETNKNAVPESYWGEMIVNLEGFARFRWVSGGVDLARAQIMACGKTRHESAFSTLKAVANMDVDTREHKELKDLAARYVDTWNPVTVPPIVAVAAPVESVVLARKWYVS